MLTYEAPGHQPRGISLLLALSVVIGVAASAPQDTVIEIPIRDTKLGGVHLAMPPQATGRVPVVIFVTTGDETAMAGIRSLSNVMGKDGIAVLRYPVPLVAAPETSGEFEAAVVTVAATVSFLRNDTRFSTITVAGDAGGASIAAVAARVARADTATTFSLDNPATITKAVRDLELPGAPRPRRNTGQRASLRDTTIATIDGARIGIEYGRPSKRGRVIWGNLVKWGGWWMPGADEATTFTTNKALTFGSLAVPAGDYTIYTQPAESELLLIINSETGQFHTVYHPERDLGRVPMTKEIADPVSERMTFVVEPRPGGGGALKLIWDDRAYVVPFVVNR